MANSSGSASIPAASVETAPPLDSLGEAGPGSPRTAANGPQFAADRQNATPGSGHTVEPVRSAEESESGRSEEHLRPRAVPPTDQAGPPAGNLFADPTGHLGHRPPESGPSGAHATNDRTRRRLAPTRPAAPPRSTMPDSVRKGIRLNLLNLLRGVNAAWRHLDDRQEALLQGLIDARSQGFPEEELLRIRGEAITLGFSSDDVDELLHTASGASARNERPRPRSARCARAPARTVARGQRACAVTTLVAIQQEQGSSVGGPQAPHVCGANWFELGASALADYLERAAVLCPRPLPLLCGGQGGLHREDH